MAIGQIRISESEEIFNRQSMRRASRRTVTKRTEGKRKGGATETRR